MDFHSAAETNVILQGEITPEAATLSRRSVADEIRSRRACSSSGRYIGSTPIRPLADRSIPGGTLAGRSPTRTRWETEYACRAGTTNVFFTGDDPASLNGYANVPDEALRAKLGEPPDDTRFPFDDRYPFTAPVGSFKPNPWGLYDMIGNVRGGGGGVRHGRFPDRVDAVDSVDAIDKIDTRDTKVARFGKLSRSASVT